MQYIAIVKRNSNNELYHHGVKGMKWGVRRFQNPDGSLTEKGIKRYAQKGYAQDSYKSNKNVAGKIWDKTTGAHKIAGETMYNLSSKKANKARAEQYLVEKNRGTKRNTKKSTEQSENTTTKKSLSDKQKRAIKVGAAAVGTALAAYGGYKLSKHIKQKAYKMNLERGTKVVKDYMRKYDKRMLDSIDAMFPTLEERSSMKAINYANKAFDISDRLSRDLYDQSFTYAKRNSEKLIPAIKTVIGKNKNFRPLI